jgi:hypothetical protein
MASSVQDLVSAITKTTKQIEVQRKRLSVAEKWLKQAVPVVCQTMHLRLHLLSSTLEDDKQAILKETGYSAIEDELYLLRGGSDSEEEVPEWRLSEIKDELAYLEKKMEQVKKQHKKELRLVKLLDKKRAALCKLDVDMDLVTHMLPIVVKTLEENDVVRMSELPSTIVDNLLSTMTELLTKEERR